MAASARDPLRVPSQFWQRADVASALGRRDIACLFRLLRQYCGASQTQIGTAVGMTQSTVSLIVTRDKPVTTLAVLERIADGLDMPDEARMRLGLAPKEDPMKRRTALGLGLLGALSPATLATVLRESAAEALEFTRERAVSAVGTGTLQHLTTVVAELDRAYPWRAADELFPVARAYRQCVEQLINGKHTLAEARELYVLGSYLSHILADLAYDLSSTLTAQAYAIDSQQLAKQAGHGELYAWAADTLASVTLASGAAGRATTIALNGLTRVPKAHPLAARLHARVALGYARQGDQAATIATLAEAQRASERLPDEMPSRFTTDSAEHTTYTVATYAATCYVSLGAWSEAETQARTACGVAPWSPGRAAYAQLDLGLALANQGSPDEAVEHGTQALSLGRGYGSLLPKAGQLDAALRNRYPKESAAIEFHEKYQQLAVGA